MKLVHITGGGVFLGSVQFYQTRPPEIWATAQHFAPYVEKACGVRPSGGWITGGYSRREIERALLRLEGGESMTLSLAGVDYPAPQVFYTSAELTAMVRAQA